MTLTNELSVLATALGAAGIALVATPTAAQPKGSVSWSGVYVGVNAGWNSSNSEVAPAVATVDQISDIGAGGTVFFVPSATFATRRMEFSDQSWKAGGEVGINRQMGHVVFGLEGDMDAVGGHSAQASRYALEGIDRTTSSTVIIDRHADPNWTASARLRIGWATGPVLLYGTGGVGIAEVRQSASYSYAPTLNNGLPNGAGISLGSFVNGASANNTLPGWILGVGVETAINRQVSIGAEYLHSDFGTTAFGFAALSAGPTHENVPIHFANDALLAKVNLKLGGLF